MTFLSLPLVQGAISGAVAAALIDFAAFRSWKSFNDALSYTWSIALFRWVQGAVVGAVTSLGLGVTS